MRLTVFAELEPTMIEQKQNGAASIDIADILVAILTSAALPVVSHMLTLVFGDSSLWSVDCLMVLYFSSFSGWILRESFRLAMVQSGLKARGYTFMDSDAAGNAVWTFPVMVALFCWDTVPGLMALLVIYCAAAFFLSKNKGIICIDAEKMCFIGVTVSLTVPLTEGLLAFYEVDISGTVVLIVFILFLVYLISFNYLVDRIRIWHRERKR